VAVLHLAAVLPPSRAPCLPVPNPYTGGQQGERAAAGGLLGCVRAAEAPSYEEQAGAGAGGWGGDEATGKR
jgi:hypothetical protein